MRSSSVPVVILGAGLSGLSAALHLKRAGVHFRLLERGEEPGGHAITREERGYRFDRTGHLLHLRNKEMQELVGDLLPNRLLHVQRRSRVFSHGVYTRYPFQANTFGLPPEVAYECVLGFLQAHKKIQKKAPENFEDFCTIHFGSGFSKHFMVPYNEKLWGVSLREITAEWCERFVPIPSVEDVIAGAVGFHHRELGYNCNFLYPRSGIGELPAALAREVGSVETQRTPLRIDPQRRSLLLSDEEIHYEHLISTIPLDTLGGLLSDIPRELRSTFAHLRCTGLYYLDVALQSPLLQDFHWAYVPEQHFPFYRVGCYSHFSPEVAPPGHASLYVELADRRPPEMDRLVPEVIQGLIEMQLIDNPKVIDFVRLRYLPHAYVIFDPRYFSSTSAIHKYLGQQKIQSVGRYGGWNYSSMEDALLYGRAAAQSILSTTSPE